MKEINYGIEKISSNYNLYTPCLPDKTETPKDANSKASWQGGFALFYCSFNDGANGTAYRPISYGATYIVTDTPMGRPRVISIPPGDIINASIWMNASSQVPIRCIKVE